MKKKLSLLIGLGAGFLQAAPLQNLKLALNWKPEPQFGGFYAGVEQGIFEKHGFRVTLLPGGAGSPVSQLLESDNVDLGIVTGDEVVVGRARGLSLKALFAVYQDFPQGIMTHASQKIESFEALFQSPGELAVQKGVAYTLFLQKKYGRNARVKVVPYIGGIGPFENNEHYSQQCFVTSEPLVAEKKGLKVKVLPISESGYNPYTTVVVAKDAWLKKHAAHLPELSRALRESWEAYLKDPGPTNLVMQKLNPAMDLESFARSAEAQRPLILKGEAKGGLGKMTAVRWAALAKQLEDLKIIPHAEADPKVYFEAIGEP